MSKLTAQERKIIYEEEKAKLEKNESSFMGNLILFAITVLSVGLLAFVFKSGRRQFVPTLKSLRQAHEGLDSYYDEENEEETR